MTVVTALDAASLRASRSARRGDAVFRNLARASGVLVFGILGLIGCFLPFWLGASFWDFHAHEGGRHVYLVLAASFAVVLLLRLPKMSRMRRVVALPVTVALAFVGLSAALTQRPGEKAELPDNPMSADRVRWEHIQRVYEMCERNVSETARRLNMHRRTLQRILAKHAPK